jgi:hypothetical protein
MLQELKDWFRNTPQGLSIRVGMKLAMKMFPFVIVFGGCVGISFERDYDTFYGSLATLFISYAIALYIEPAKNKIPRDPIFLWKAFGFFAGVVATCLCLFPAVFIVFGLTKLKILRGH